GSAAPTVVFDASGNVYVSFMAATFLGSQPRLTNPDSDQRKFGFQSNNGIFVAKSTNGGLSFATPVPVVEHVFTGTQVFFECFPSMAVDSLGHLYVVWNRFYPNGQFPGDTGSVGGSDVMIAVSTNEGASWTTQLRTRAGTGAGTGVVSVIQDPIDFNSDEPGEGRGFIGFPSVTVGAGDAIYVGTNTGGFFTVYSSTDGAASFKTPNFTVLRGTPFDYNGTQVRPDATF